jgi:hypothetical protein
LHRKQSTHRAAQRSALHRNQLASHRSAHRIPCITAYCITNNPRTVQRSAAHCIGFSSLVKQNKKGKNCAVFCFAGKRKMFFYLFMK